MIEFWNSISVPQATIISGLLTILAAVIGVWLGSELFSGKVRDLKSALEQSRSLIDAYEKTVNEKLSAIISKIERLSDIAGGLDEQVAAQSSSVAQIQGEMIELRDTVAQGPDQTPETDKDAIIRGYWDSIREQLETEASDRSIDGRTRARYSRIDRRNYHNLIQALANDGNLDNPDAFYGAVQLWQHFKNGRRTPSDQDLENMAAFATAVGAGYSGD